MRTAFITGASSGIGEEFAKVFAKKGYRLILTGRNHDKLQELKNKFEEEYHSQVATFCVDLEIEEACLALMDKLDKVRIDVFINNAGFGACGRFTETDLNKEISMIRVNDIAMHILFKLMLVKMEKQGRGVILNVASSAGLLPGGPYMATYYASKAYVVSLTRAVHQELKESKSKVYVCALCPGPVDTRFNERADVSFALPGITAEFCVQAAMWGMRLHKTIIVPGLGMAFLMKLQRHLPMGILMNLTGRQQKKKLYSDKDNM